MNARIDGGFGFARGRDEVGGFGLRGVTGQSGGGAAHAALIELRRMHLKRFHADEDLIDIQRHGDAQTQRQQSLTRDDVAQGRAECAEIDRVGALQHLTRFDQALQMRAEAADAIGVVGAQGGVRAVGQPQRDRIERGPGLIGQL